MQKIYVITDRQISGLSHVEQVERLIAGGARLVQIREKNASARDFYAQVRAAVDIAKPLGVQIIVNDRADIALAAKADGVHLGQDDMPPELAREILGGEANIGFSTHSIEQAVAAAKLPVDYIAIGPVFDTSTKADADPVVGLEGLKEVRAAVGEIPLVAIGGINFENVKQVLAAGADSAAIISALIADADKIEQKMAELQNIVKHS